MPSSEPETVVARRVRVLESTAALVTVAGLLVLIGLWPKGDGPGSPADAITAAGVVWIVAAVLIGAAAVVKTVDERGR